MPTLLLLAALLASGDPMADANSDFRALYREAKQRALASAGPSLLVEGDTLVLRDGAVREAARFLPEGYTKLKEVSHVPLALFVALHGNDGPLAPQLRRSLKALSAEVRRANVQDPVLDASLALAGKVLQRGTADSAEVDAFARRMGPLLSAKADAAAAMELDALSSSVTAMRARLGARWPQIHVIVMGAHMARTNEISAQYFQRLLGEAGEGGRIIFAEGVWDEEKALDLLATHLVDGAAGMAFFGDSARLHEDMLAEGAMKHLDAHPPK
jgi:hypothetical protein